MAWQKFLGGVNAPGIFPRGVGMIAVTRAAKILQPGGSTLQDSAFAPSTPIGAKVDLSLRMFRECAHHGSVPHITASRVLNNPRYAALAAHPLSL